MNQVSAAESEVDLAASRAILARSALFLDDYYQTDRKQPQGAIDTSPEASFKLLKNSAATKKFVMETAAKIVDRSLTLYGGGAYVGSNTLARLYRDVRAGQFMQPWASNQAIELIGKVTLGVNPNEE